MMDTARVKDGVIVQVWRGIGIEEFPVDPFETDPVYEFPAGTAVCGMLFDGSQLSMPQPVVTVDDYRIAVQRHIDETAQSHNYADGNSLVTYANDPISPLWAAEGSAFKAWRSMVWVYVYQQLELVQSGRRAQPTIAELIDELPTMAWPEA